MKEPFVSLSSEITRENALILIQWLQDQEVVRYLSDARDVSCQIQQAIDRVHLPVLTHLFSQNGRFFLAYNRQNMPVGFLRLAVRGSEVEMVIVIGDRSQWGNRLGSAVIREGMKHAFFTLRAKRVLARIHRQNIRSIRAFLRMGFRSEHDTQTHRCFSMTMERYLKSIVAGPAKEIYITEIDRDRLKRLIDEELHKVRGEVPDPLRNLEYELDRAVIMNPQVLPGTVVTMNTKALLSLDQRETEVSLRYPGDTDGQEKCISVFSTVGTAILGYSEGDRILWETPHGEVDITVNKILYQPEAAGDYHL